MLGINQNVFYQYLVDILLLLIAGVAEYMHLVPPNTFYPILFAVVGHVIGTVTTASVGPAIQENTAATIKNTEATTDTKNVNMLTK